MRALLILPLIVVGCRSHPAPVSQADVAMGSSRSLVAAIERSDRTRLVLHIADASGKKGKGVLDEVRLLCGKDSFPVEAFRFPRDFDLPGCETVDLGELASCAESQPSTKISLVMRLSSGRETVLVDLRPLFRRSE